MPISNMPANLNQSVWSACEIIKYLTGKGWCRLKDISQDLNIEQAKAHRLLNTLVAHDFVQLDEDTRKYRLGLQFYSISYRMSKDTIVHTAKVYLEQAAAELFETINMGMLSHDKAKLVHVYRIDGALAADYSDVPLGVSRFINESALGKVILAHLPFGEQQAILNRLEFKQYTDNTILTRDDFQKDLFGIVQRGYAIDAHERSSDCYCIAMPIFDGSDRVVAAVSVSMRAQPSQKKAAKVIRVLKHTADQICAHIR